MSHFHDIYDGEAEAYHRLVMAEDFQGELRAELLKRCDFEGKDAVEAGAGTGRLTRLLLDAGVRSMVATEPAAAMRQVAARYLEAFGPRCTITDGEVEALPVADGAFDVAVAGWVVGHFTDWYPEDWQTHTDRAMAEFFRVLRPGGTLILVESLGTGNTEPRPPTARHADYYQYLQAQHGMAFASIRTDYRFGSVDEAAEVMGFFFGESFCEQIRQESWSVIPECTGVWSVQKPASVS